MSAIVTIFNRELQEHQDIAQQLWLFSSEVSELEDVSIFKPTSGLLMTFMSLLQQQQLSYVINFDSIETS